MYSITLEINQICNLQCDYCYLGKMDNEIMLLQTAEKAVNFALRQVKNHKDKQLIINFIGGEPLLNFEMIKDIVEMVERLKDGTFFVQYAITTNATILNNKIIEFFIRFNFDLKVSLDGSKDINDLNRLSKSGNSVYEDILNNRDYLSFYEKKTEKTVQVTNVITGNNYMFYYSSLKYLAEDLQFKIIDTSLDTFREWKKEEFSILTNEIDMAFNWFKETYSNKLFFVWEFLNEVKRAVMKKFKDYSCGGGLICSYIRTSGDIFACPSCFHETCKLGNVWEGVSKTKVNFLRSYIYNNDYCKNCEIYDYCGARGCIMHSYEKNNDFNKPNEILCWMQKYKYSFYYKNQEFLKKLYNGE